MRIYSYSPSVDVYAAVRTSGEYQYLDLSGDVVSCVVSRVTDGASTFSVRLQNSNMKYNGVFEPFDRVSIKCTKRDYHPLIVGYITKAPKFTTYGADITIEGSCPIYRLQQYYWDPKLYYSQIAMGKNGAEITWDAVLVNLLCDVAGYSPDQVFIGDMPAEAMDVARDCYTAGFASSEQIKNMVNEFYEVLQTHGPQFSSSSSTSSSGLVGNGISLLGDGVDFDVSEKKFVSTWGPKIDKFFDWYSGQAGEPVPLQGKGDIFARAGYTHRYDPRISPAISINESGAGRAPYHNQYNVWGWKTETDWGSWEEAINGHLDGLVRIYGDMRTVAEFAELYTSRGHDDTDGWIARIENYMGMITNF